MLFKDSIRLETMAGYLLLESFTHDGVAKMHSKHLQGSSEPIAHTRWWIKLLDSSGAYHEYLLGSETRKLKVLCLWGNLEPVIS